MRVGERCWCRHAIGCLIWAGLACSAPAQGPIVLRDVTQQTGITFRHTDGMSGQRYIVETVSAGLALFDYDGDGDIDVYFLNGAPLRGSEVTTLPRNALYRNEGHFRFTDVTNQAGVGDTGFGLGVTVGDYDNDGNPDLYLNNYGANVLYRNNGDGTFSDVTEKAGVANGHKVGAGTNFLDMDQDGDLDLFVCNYVDFTYDNHRVHHYYGFPIYAGPLDFAPVPDTLYRNNGDRTFTDVSETSGVAASRGAGMGTVCADYDDDGDTDIIVANDVGANFLYRNDGSGKFAEVGLQAGLAYDGNGDAQASMGVDCGDYDNDGWLDFHFTSYAKEFPTLYRNMGNGLLQDMTFASKAGVGTFVNMKWGNGLVDFDNDGDRDLFLACGDLQDNIEQWDNARTYMAQNILLMNQGNGTFVNVSNTSGDGMAVKSSSRGAGFDDLDNDGDVDVVILNSRSEPTVLRNDSIGNHWIQIRLRGVNANRDGIGARVQVTSGNLVQVAEVHSGRGYQSHFGTRLHFGLGQRQHVDRIDIRWPGGTRDTVTDLLADRFVTITEGGSKVRSTRAAGGEKGE